MLNLRQVNRDSERSHATEQRSTIHFSTNIIVGNMGESLQFGAQSHDDGVEDDVDENTAAPSSLSDFDVPSDTGPINRVIAVTEVSEYINIVLGAR